MYVCTMLQHAVWYVMSIQLLCVAEFMVFVVGMPLEQVAGMFDSATLQHLKQEYGGLQTLLRNHHQVFEGVLC